MTDINAKAGERPETPAKTGGKAARTAALPGGDSREIRFIELLFFAYRDFISDPDAALIAYGFGRAHHRVIHFVNRHPGIRVADLLDILKITKKSHAGVLKHPVSPGSPTHAHA